MLPGSSLPPFKWGAADVDGLVKFLVGEKSFSEERIRKTVEKMNASRSKANQGARATLTLTLTPAPSGHAPRAASKRARC